VSGYWNSCGRGKNRGSRNLVSILKTMHLKSPGELKGKKKEPAEARPEPRKRTGEDKHW